MSIILDALQKAGGTHPPSSSSSPSPAVGRSWIVGLGILMVGLGVVALFAGPRRNPSNAPASLKPTTLAAQPAPRTEGLRLLRVAENQWRLNGIVQGGGGKSLALINGQVVEEGAQFQGARIARISQGEVEIEQEGQRSTLTLE